MDELIEISSDSNDTIIVTPTRPENFYDLSSSDGEVEDKIHENTCTDAKSDDILEKLYKKYLSQEQPANAQNEAGVLSEIEMECEVQGDNMNPQSESNIRYEKQKELSDKKTRTEKHATKRKIDLEQQRNQKKLLREQQKALKDQEKNLKDIMKMIHKNSTKDGCIKTITIEIDQSLLQESYGEAIIAALKDYDILYKQTNSFSHHLTWTRKTQILENMVLHETESNEFHHLVVISSKDFSTFVRNDQLLTYVTDIHIKTNFRHIILVIFGCDKAKDDRHEAAMLEIEMNYKCLWHFAKSEEDLANIIIFVTKAVAQIPYKKEQEEKYLLQNFYLKDSKKDTVKVDRNGSGLGRLWKQMLTVFPLASLEHAEAITVVYPTPKALFEAYRTCDNKERMLQDLPIRRAPGPSTTARKLGPEFSKKCSIFFNVKENIPL